MNIDTITIIDACILLYIILCGVIGLKEGAIRKTCSFIGLIIVLILAFHFKNKLSVYFYENLPFLNLWGVFKGIQTLNILFYETVAFAIIVSVLMIVYNVIIAITGIFQKVVDYTVILGIPSKLIGFLIGIIEGYIWLYIILFILTLPVFNIKIIQESKYANRILSGTPILSKYTEKTLDLYNGVYTIITERENKTDKEINEESMDLMLQYNVITVESAEKLIDEDKVEVNDRSFLEKYK